MKRWIDRTLAALLALVLVVGLLPASPASAEPAKELAVEAVEEDAPEEGSPEEGSPEEGGTLSLSARSSVEPLATSETGNWTNRPGLEVRVLAGDGGDKEAGASLHDLDYSVNKLQQFTLCIEVTYYPGHGSPVLTIDSSEMGYELFYIGKNGYTDPAAIGAGTVEAQKYGSHVRKLVYHLNPAEHDMVKVELNVTFTPNKNPYPTLAWPLGIDFTADSENGTPSSVYVDRDASAVTCRNVPQDNFLTDSAYATTAVTVEQGRDALASGEGGELSFYVFQTSVQDCFLPGTPNLNYMELRLQPLDPNLEIVGAKCDYSSAGRKIEVEREGGIYVLKDIPFSAKLQYKLSLKLRNTAAEYDTDYRLKLAGVTLIQKADQVELAYVQNPPPADRVLSVKTMKAPVSGTLTLTCKSTAGDDLWFNARGDMDAGGQKYTGTPLYYTLNTEFGPEAEGAEQVPCTNLSVEVPLPKGLGPGCQFSISGDSIQVEFRRKGAGDWESGAPYLSAASNPWMTFRIPEADPDGAAVERVRIADGGGGEPMTSLTFYLKDGWAVSPDRNSGALTDGQKEVLTILGTGQQPGGGADRIEIPHTITYRAYDAPKAVDCISFTGRNSTSATSGSYWDICSPSGMVRPPAQAEQADLPCYTGREWSVKGSILVKNASTASGTRPIPQTNMVFELKPEPGVELVGVEKNTLNSNGTANVREVFTDGAAPVDITLHSGTTLHKTQADLPYTAPEGDPIDSVRYTFPKQLTAQIPVWTPQQNYSPFFTYRFNVPPDSPLAQTGGSSYDYVTLSFLGSDEVPFRDDGAPQEIFTVHRDVPVVVPAFTSPGPYTFRLGYPKPTASAVTAGGRITIKPMSSSSSTASIPSADALLDRGVPDVHVNLAAEERALEGVHYVAYQVNKNFTYVNQSLRLANGSPEVEVTWQRNFFANGDGLLRFRSVDGVPMVSSFELSVSVATPQSTYVPVSKAWLGGDFTGLFEVTAGTYASDQDGRVAIRYTPKSYETEQNLGLDLDGDGVTGNGTAAAVLLTQNSTHGVAVSAVSLEGVYAYGSSQEDFVEGSGPYYGRGNDVFTYRTRVMSISSHIIQNLVAYVPIPRAGRAPVSSAAANEWDAVLLGLEGSVMDKLGGGSSQYQLWYSTKDNAMMQELNGLEDVADTYVSYDPDHPPDWSKVTMLKLKASDLPAAVSDDLGLTFQNQAAPRAQALSNHMETYFRYNIDRKDGSGAVAAFGPTSSVRFILPYLSVEGQVYLDRDFDGGMDLNGHDRPLSGITVGLCDSAGQRVAEAVTGVDGGFVLAPPAEGVYTLRVDPAALGNGETPRHLLPQGSGSSVRPDTGVSTPFQVSRDGVTGKQIGVYEERDFAYYTDAAYTQPLADGTLVDLSLNGKESLYAKVLPSYAVQTAGVQPGTALSGQGKVSAALANSVLTLNGLAVTAADSPVTVTSTLPTGAGETVTHSFRVRVLPPRVVAKFEDNLNFYTDILYSKEELAGGITLQNQSYEGADLLPGGLQATAVYRYKSDGTIDRSQPAAWGEMGPTKTFTQAQMGKFALCYEGTDIYGRRVVDTDGREEILRTVYVHGYPYFFEDSPIQARLNAGYDPMMEQDGTTYLTATHEHVYTDAAGRVEHRRDETFSAAPAKGDITLLGYYPYRRDGGDFDAVQGKFRTIDITEPGERAKLLTSTPTEAGAYEVYYSVRMGTRAAVLTLHRTLYLHGSPSMYVPTIISMAPEQEAGVPKTGPMDLDYASQEVWKGALLDMRELDHVRENGTVATYDRATTKFYRQNGNPLDLGDGTGGEIDGWSVIAAPKQGVYGGRPANAFLKADSLHVLQNTPGVYEVTVVFQDTIDGMGEPGPADAWNENWGALYREGGTGYTEIAVKVLVTSGDAKPVLPSQDQLVTNFVLGDSVWFSRLTDFDDLTMDEIETTCGAAAAAELRARIASRRVVQLEYEDWVRYYQAEERKIDGSISDPAEPSHFQAKTGEDLLYMLNQAIRYKTHDVDIHALKPTPGAVGSLSEDEYKALHQAAVALLWKSIKLSELRVPVPGQESDRVYQDPGNQDLLEILAAGEPGTLEAAFSACDVQVTAGGASDVGNLSAAADPGVDSVSGYGYTLALDRTETVAETYKIYVYSDLKFERASGAPLVTYGLHIPSSQPHTSMALNAYYISAKNLQKKSYPAASANPDIRAAGTYRNMDYSYTHPIQGVLPTLRASTVHYYGRAFVNAGVELRYRGEDTLPGGLYFLAGADGMDLVSDFTARLDKWTGLPADTGLAGASADYPPVKGEAGVNGTAALTGAEFKADQPAVLRVYEGGVLLYDSYAPGTGGTLVSRAPAKRVLTYVAEDPGGDADHPYHNGPNQKSAEIAYVFDAPVSLSFGPGAERKDGGWSLKVLDTDTDAQIAAKLDAAATVVYGDDPELAPSAVAVETAVTRDGAGRPQSVAVTAAARGGNVAQGTVALVVQQPPVILVHMEDETGSAVASPITIEGAVIAQPYTVPAPYVEGYAPVGDLVKTIASVREGENDLSFTYRPVGQGERLVDYAIVYQLADGTVLLSLEASGPAGREVAHTAPDLYYHAGVRYALAEGEGGAKRMTLSEGGENRLTYLYEPAPEAVGVSYTVQYVYEDAAGSTAVAETHTLTGTVGSSVSAAAPASFQLDGYQYTRKPGEPGEKTLVLGRDPAGNVISFRYDRAPIQTGGGGGGGGGTTLVHYYAVLFIPGPYGTLRGEGERQVRSGAKLAKAPEVVPAEGYEFLGWYIEDPDKLVEPAGQVVKGNLTFYAAYRGPDGEAVGGTDASGGSPTPLLNRDDHIVYLFGDDRGTFRPDAPITRAEVAAMYARLLRDPMPSDFTAPAKFSDVDPAAWYAQSVSYLEKYGILQGYEDGTFRPDRAISRAEFVVVTTRFTQMTLTDKQQFTDVPLDYWAAVQIDSAKVQGWLNGYPDGTFRPDELITRAEAAKTVNGLLGRSPDRAYIESHGAELVQFPDLASTYWGYDEIMEATNAHDHTSKDGVEIWKR